jgi:hypothetical protein
MRLLPFEDLPTSLGHPLGRRILRFCEELEAPASPTQIAAALETSLAEIERHAARLTRDGVLRPVADTESGEGLYRSALDDGAGEVRAVLEASRESDATLPRARESGSAGRRR